MLSAHFAVTRCATKDAPYWLFSHHLSAPSAVMSTPHSQRSTWRTCSCAMKCAGTYSYTVLVLLDITDSFSDEHSGQWRSAAATSWTVFTLVSFARAARRSCRFFFVSSRSAGLPS